MSLASASILFSYDSNLLFLKWLLCARVYLNIIYTVVEVIRNIEVGESEELKKVQESFFNELSK